MPQRNEPPLVYLITGEPSGDWLASKLMAALKRKTDGEIAFRGVGGPRMQEEGFRSLFPLTELSVMGFVEVLPKARRILRRIAETAADVRDARPAIVVSVDSSSFTFRVHKRLAGIGVPRVHYVAPMVWAWKEGRAAKMAGFLDHVLCLWPFEPPYFERHGLAATFVGHPAVEQAEGDGTAFRDRHGLAPDRPILCVLPGSRRMEVRRLLPLFKGVVEELAGRHPNLAVAVPTVPGVAAEVRAGLRDWPVDARVVEGEGEKLDAFAASTAALAASGTIGLELAMANLPAVIAYKVNPITAAIARRLIKVRFASPVNIVLDREVQPEFLQGEATVARIAPAVDALLSDDAARRAQMEAYGEAASQMRSQMARPSERAAEVLLSLIAEKKSA